MESPQLYNSSNLLVFCEYISKYYPEIDMNEVLECSSITPLEISDAGQWFTQEQIDKFYYTLLKKTKNSYLAVEAGKYAAEAKSTALLRQYALGFITPHVAYWMFGKLGSTISRHIDFNIKYLSMNKIEAIAIPKEGILEKSYQCENRIGLLKGLAKVFTDEYAVVQHDQCLHKGNDSCKYIASWKITIPLIWKLISRYTSAISVISTLILLFLLPLNLWLYYFLIAGLVSTTTFAISEIQSKKDLNKSIESQQNVAEQLINQFNIRYNELSLIKEIGEAVSRILDPSELFRFTAEALQKHLQFKRGMIMLANPEKTKLVYMSGFGYEPDEEKLLQDSYFSLDKPNSQGVFYLTFKEQKPYIITNAEEIKKYLSDKSVAFMSKLGVSSFISVPIIYEGKPEGILAVDSSKNETLPTQSDVSLLSGIAHQIGISLNNARAHKKVKESEERFRSLSNNAPDIIYQTDNKGIITYTNPAWKEVLGHNLSDIINSNITEFIREENQDEFTEIFNQIIENKNTIRDKTFTFLNNKGLPRFVTFTGTPDIDDAGNVTGVIGTLKDISRLRSMEAQLLQASKMEALGVLTGGVAHDFNNIIQAIMGYNQILIAGKNNTDADMQYLKNTRELISRSRELVQQLLLYSRKTELTFKPLDLNEEIENVKALLSKSVPKMIKIKTIYAKDLSPIVADSTQIGQVLMNLVINSRDAMGDEGTITISTSNYYLAEDTIMYGVNVPAGNYARILSTDTGCGMSEDVISHIFEPFFTTKEAGSGTGLGLSVVYGIVKSVQGFIFCQSKPDEGTSFEILIPSSTNVSQDAQQIEKKTKIRRGREKLLIVDDESYILETVKETLGSYGYKVLTADTTEEALDIYSSQKDKIKLVLLDLNMPGRGGKKTLADLLKINNQAKILMTSGFSSPDQVEDLINSGAAGFLSKPYNPEELLVNVRNILDTPANQPLLF